MSYTFFSARRGISPRGGGRSSQARQSQDNGRWKEKENLVNCTRNSLRGALGGSYYSEEGGDGGRFRRNFREEKSEKGKGEG